MPAPAYDSQSDAELMLAFQDGDVDAFTELYQRHLKGLLNFFFRLSWNRTLAEDLTQEVLLRVFRLARDWTPQAKFTTFLYRIARNLWIDHLRSAAVRRAGGSLDAPSGAADGTSFLDLLPAEANGPHVDIERRELYAQIMSALSTLPDEQRMVFVLAEVEGMKYAEISDVLDVPVGTVKSRMHAAVAKLQSALSHLDPARREGEVEA